jgi:hypothetical protein
LVQASLSALGAYGLRHLLAILLKTEARKLH